MGTVKVKATSLAFNVEPEKEYTFVAVGDEKHIESFTSDAPGWIQDLLESWVNENQFLMKPSFFIPEAGTMLNFVGMMDAVWSSYPDKIHFEAYGDIGTIPFDGNVVY